MNAPVRALLGWATGGSALAALVSVLLAVCALVLGLIYRRYLLLLGADRRRPAERQAYDGLRNSLAEGNMAARLYAERLSRFLDWVDRFFGDAEMADRTLCPSAFGLRRPAPLWTAPALDRCLLLALLYPILTIFAIWAVSGHVGPAEAALHFKPNVSGWHRGVAAAGVGLMLFYLRSFSPLSWKALISIWFFLLGASAAAYAVIGEQAYGVFVVLFVGFAVSSAAAPVFWTVG
jgi:hypothetical protein